MKRYLSLLTLLCLLASMVLTGCAGPAADPTDPPTDPPTEPPTDPPTDPPTEPPKLKILFIGNSATSVNNVPRTLARVAGRAGYEIEVDSCTEGGYTLSQHADETTAYGKSVYDKIANGGYDVVFLQENCSNISTAAKRQETKDACKKLSDAVTAAGGQTFVYVRPPYGYSSWGLEPKEQCMELDKLFGEISDEVGTTNAYVNRAYAYAMDHCELELWGSDNAHTSPHGAYLVVCVMFATLYNTSSTVLDGDTLIPADAVILQQIADKIVLEKHIPWTAE